MKKLLLSLILILSVILFLPLNASAETLEKYNGEICHFFTHALLANPKKALSKDNPMSNSFDKDCLTPFEFKNILLQFYENNYCLIDIDKTFTVNKNGKTYKKQIFLPKGKKPLILSFDDIVYDHKKANLGMVDKLVLDKNNEVAAKTNLDKNPLSYTNEFLPILETFIKKYPSFSIQNARAVICLTGFDGIFGYRTQSNNITNRASEINEVRPLIKVLKEKGYKFACHGYGHYHMKKLSAERLAIDTQKWLNEVGSLVGTTNLYCYPYGEWVLETATNDTDPKHNALLSKGFNMFFGVGDKNYFSSRPFNTKKSMLMDRCPMDGLSLRKMQQYYAHMFSCIDVYDCDNRLIPFN